MIAVEPADVSTMEKIRSPTTDLTMELSEGERLQ